MAAISGQCYDGFKFEETTTTTDWDGAAEHCNATFPGFQLAEFKTQAQFNASKSNSAHSIVYLPDYVSYKKNQYILQKGFSWL